MRPQLLGQRYLSIPTLMTQQEQSPQEYDSLGGVFVKAPLRSYHLGRLLAFVLVVAGLLWVQWRVLQLHERLAVVLPTVGDLMPDRAGRWISWIASVLVILATWTATWGLWLLTDQPLRIRLRNFLELIAIICVYGVIVLAAEAVVGNALRADPFMSTINLPAHGLLLVFLLRLRSQN